MAKVQDITYMLQHATKNDLKGVSPVSNRKMFISFFQPSFLYGLDTLGLNKGDIEHLETSYRSVIKHMLAVPDNTPSCTIYLPARLFPAEAQRDLDILGLLGQLSVCPSDLQKVTDIIHHNLGFYDSQFRGWSGLVRQTAAKYSQPDPADYMMAPWQQARWRAHCSDTIAEYCMTLGVYKTRVNLHKMKVIKSPMCTACNMNVPGSLSHYLLYCPFVEVIRQEYVPKFILSNPQVTSLVDNEESLIISILDPESSIYLSIYLYFNFRDTYTAVSTMVVKRNKL